MTWRELVSDMGLPFAIVMSLVICGVFVFFNDPNRHKVCTQWSGPDAWTLTKSTR